VKGALISSFNLAMAFQETTRDLTLQLQDVCAESDKLLDSYERAVDEYGILSQTS
jgi:hypothetical protein